jgi:hypothetical protein
MQSLDGLARLADYLGGNRAIEVFLIAAIAAGLLWLVTYLWRQARKQLDPDAKRTLYWLLAVVIMCGIAGGAYRAAEWLWPGVRWAVLVDAGVASVLWGAIWSTRHFRIALYNMAPSRAPKTWEDLSQKLSECVARR